ncbi:MAG: 2-succinyl-5-enolpyruvyl-6-hydroxy-3-cyclohexene-1-carboxylate synthase [Bacteroidia bacterium 43-41]|nr:MAG: 2-succinyl-5-enolpyruvyl-6-hydroxy-3-cyclohexene-1-carboxylate synthase [Bacteroidia bacterium 43-41]
MANYYTDERNVQIVVALLKKHGIKKIISSPGSANSPLTISLQIDSFFEIYSSVDERSAAYIACGLAAESGEPVVISCTGATASRNYLPGLTEAYYRKLPILAITSTRKISKIGHLVDQVMDRTILPKDVARISVTLPIVETLDDVWECEIKVNQAILELKRHGGGPSHINLPTNYIGSFCTLELPDVRIINRITINDKFPELPRCKVAVFIGSHVPFSKEQISIIENFCAVNNAVVLCDHTSGYSGKFKVLFPLINSQIYLDKTLLIPDILIHIGEISAFFSPFISNPTQVWRISEDGEIRDTFLRLRYIFEMSEHNFFEYYSSKNIDGDNDEYYQSWATQFNRISEKTPELPFSNVWIAQQIVQKIPKDSVIHFGILNSLRSWNYFEMPSSITSASNVGGFGIDGNLSSLLGASLAHKGKLYFGIVGDLSFFYDMNVLGNRHIGNNLRILLVNNGKGTEFKLFMHKTAKFEEADDYVSAAGHYGNKSPELVKNYATDLGFEYLSASNKEEFLTVYKDFINPIIVEKPKLLEVFTNDLDENQAHVLMSQIETNVKGKTIQFAKKLLGESGVKTIRKIIK